MALFGRGENQARRLFGGRVRGLDAQRRRRRHVDDPRSCFGAKRPVSSDIQPLRARRRSTGQLCKLTVGRYKLHFEGKERKDRSVESPGRCAGRRRDGGGQRNGRMQTSDFLGVFRRNEREEKERAGMGNWGRSLNSGPKRKGGRAGTEGKRLFPLRSSSRRLGNEGCNRYCDRFVPGFMHT